MYREIDLSSIEDLYEITKDGKIYNKETGVELSYTKDKKGYLSVSLGKFGSHRVHRLVCLKYYPNPNYRELQVNHIDGVKTNNCITNLEWVTNAENMHHAVITGLRAHLDYSGEHNGSAKISEETAKMVINDLINHIPISQIGKKYDLSKSTISAIKNKRLWSHLTTNIEFDQDYKRVSRSQLTPTQVDEIIVLLLQGQSYKEIAQKYNCPFYVIQDIKLKRTWKNKTQNINFNTR